MAHASPGRIRLKMDRATTDLTALALVARQFREHEGTYDLTLNDTTRSLLICYEPSARQLEEVIELIRESGVPLEIDDYPEGLPLTTDASALGYAIETAAGRLNRWVADRTSGGADLRSAIPVGFALLALREVLSRRATAAPWYALAWYAFDSYWKLRQPKRDSEDVP